MEQTRTRIARSHPGRVSVFVAALSLALVAMRLAWVQHEIDTAPVVVGALSDSGYTPPDTFGHGTLIAPDGFTGWVIFDRPHVSGQVEKVCAQSVVPPADVDVDFLHIGGEWIKLRTGRATLTDMDGQALTVEPETTLWRGAITSDTAFAVRSPDPRLSPEDSVRQTSLGPSIALGLSSATAA